jgi:peroxiredoxin
MKGALRFCYCGWLCLAVLLGLQTSTAWAVMATESADSKPLAVGQLFPDLSLKGDLTPEQRAALGAEAGKQSLGLRDLKAEGVLVLVFSMYCPYCQREAPLLNELYAKLVAQGLSSRIALLGVGAGNSDLEVDVFRKKYAIAYPLFSDADYALHKVLGNVGTPYHYVLKREPKGGYRVVGGLLGSFESVDAFLESVKTQLGVEEKK